MPLPGMAKITVRTADGKTQEYELGPQVLRIGKDPSSEIYIPSQYVSRRHAEISPAGERFVIQDIGSTNGVRVNGRVLRVKEPCSLVSGDRVQLGDVVLTYEEPVVDALATAIFTLPSDEAESDVTSVYSGAERAAKEDVSAVFAGQGPERPAAAPNLGQGRSFDRTVVGAGLWTILYTDLVGHTQQLNQMGDIIGQRWLHRHNTILREQFAELGGFVDKYTGDGFLVTFASARRAVQCAIAIQRELRNHNSGRPEFELHVRIGLHTGEVLKEGDDLVGQAVNLAHHVMEVANGDEILISDLLCELIQSTHEFSIVDRGTVLLRGFLQPEHLYQVEWQEAEST